MLTVEFCILFPHTPNSPHRKKKERKAPSFKYATLKFKMPDRDNKKHLQKSMFALNSLNHANTVWHTKPQLQVKQPL